MSDLTADRIRAAVLTLRQRAAAATPGPWRDGNAYGGLVAPARGKSNRENVEAYGGDLIGESMDIADRRYLTLVHPGTATALADLLCGIAGQLELDERYGGNHRPPRSITDPAARIVDAIEAALHSEQLAKAGV